MESKVEVLRSQHLGRDLVEFLTRPTPKEFIDKRPVGGGRKVDYIYGHYFIQKLNDAFGFLWSSEVPEVFEKGNHIVAKVQVSVHIPGHTTKITHPDGTVEETRWDPVIIKKTQFGGSEIKRYSEDSKNYKKGDVIDLANDYKGAATDGLKKAGTHFGIGLDVYGKTREQIEEGLTEEQLEVLYMRGERLGWSKEEAVKWAEKELGGSLKEYTPMDIMGLVPKLIALEKTKKLASGVVRSDNKKVVGGNI